MLKNLSVYADKNERINKKNIHAIISAIKKEIGFTIENLEIVFLNANDIQIINKQYLKHNYPTDVISFNYSDESNKLDGEIFICSQIAAENAKKYKVKYDDEIKRLLVHGVLHLLGYDDDTSKKRNEMKLIEDFFISKTKKYGKVIL